MTEDLVQDREYALAAPEGFMLLPRLVVLVTTHYPFLLNFIWHKIWVRGRLFEQQLFILCQSCMHIGWPNVSLTLTFQGTIKVLIY